MTSICILLGLGAVALPAADARAQESGDLYYYDLPAEELRDHAVAWKNFIAYENREPCQQYWAPPAGYVMEGCNVYLVKKDMPTEVKKIEKTAPQETRPLLPVVASYNILFSYDRSNVRADQQAELARIAAEIDKYNPQQVTVSGYTDTMGSAAYNVLLSQQRAKSVAAALTAKGVQTEVIDKRAFGEEDQAVETENEVKNQDNRRVVVDFRR